MFIEVVNHLYTRDSQMSKLANSNDTDEMSHYSVFHQGLHCLLRQKQSLEKEVHVQYNNWK